MTYRERREARADRLDGWADGREAKGSARVDRAHEMAQAIPFGQPMLTDHYSYKADRNYRDRIGSNFDKGFADLRKADEMRSRAEGIRAAADRAIYSDDADAIDKLEQRIATLEAERDRIKAYNASARKGAPDVSLLDASQRQALESCARFTPGFFERKQQQMPAYALSNLSGNISTQRKRLAALKAERGAL